MIAHLVFASVLLIPPSDDVTDLAEGQGSLEFLVAVQDSSEPSAEAPKVPPGQAIRSPSDLDPPPATAESEEEVESSCNPCACVCKPCPPCKKKCHHRFRWRQRRSRCCR